MRKVAIVTESIACLTREIVAQYEIGIVPISIFFGDKTYKDWVEITPSQAYEFFLKDPELFKTSPEGQEVVIKVIKPGELFAEAILFEKDRYPVSAITLETSLVYMLPKAQFHCLLENSDFRSDFLANLMGKLRYLADQVQALTSSDVETRLFHFLKEQYGDRKMIKINLSKKDVAAAIGTTPETLSRLLLKLKKEKKLIWEGKMIKILSDRVISYYGI